MTYKNLTGFLFLWFLIISPALHAQQAVTVPENWQAIIELHPLNDQHNSDVINLVPKQSIMLKAFVWYPDTQTWVVKYPDWDMPGASIEKFNTTVANLERTQDGLQQYGHTQNYILTPVDIGTLALTQKSIDVSATKNGSEILPLSNEIQLNVSLPGGVYSIDEFLPAYGINVQQVFYHYTNAEGAKQISIAEVEKINLTKGEMLERRITLKADGIKGSSIPALTSPAMQQNAQLESHFKDVLGIFGFEGGERVESLFYLPSHGGKVVLEGLDIKWWDLNDNQSKSVSIAGVSFNTVRVDAFEEAVALSWWEKNLNIITRWLFIAFCIGATGLVLILTFKTLLKRVYSRVIDGFNKLRLSESVLLLKLAFNLLSGGKNKARGNLVQWQFSSEQKSIPQAISDYLYSEAQRTGTSAGRCEAFVSCCRLLLFRLSSVRDKRKSYGLPEL